MNEQNLRNYYYYQEKKRTRGRTRNGKRVKHAWYKNRRLKTEKSETAH